MAPMPDVFATVREAAGRHAPRRRLRPAVRLAAATAALLAAAVVASPFAAIAQSLDLPPAARAAQAGSPTALTTTGSTPATQDAPAEPVHLKAHTIVFAASAATLATVVALQPRLAPSSCRWCDLRPEGADALNSLDRTGRERLLWHRPNTASTISDVVAYGITPAIAFGLSGWGARASGRGSAFKADALVIAEAAVLASNASQALKYLTARQRPSAHARALGQATAVEPSSDDNLSFSSGHTAMAFAVAVSAARVMTLRGYRHAGWAWGLGLSAAAAVGYLRIAADRHYVTDVLASAGIGTAMGLIVPRLVLSKRAPGPASDTRATITPQFSGPFVGITYAW
jgi:membrane-associated phospholipid phosphatase